MRRRLLGLSMVSFFVLACMGGTDAEEVDTDAGDTDVAEEEGEGNDAAALPFDFPSVELDAEEGQFALVPARASLDKALKGESKVFLFYGATIVETGEETSKVNSLSQTESEMPNAIIVPLSFEGTPEAGDILLGHWQSGSGLKRAVVVKGGEEPVVRYADVEPGSTFDKEDTWEKGRYQMIDGPWDIGSSMACKEGERWTPGVLINAAEGQLIISGFAGSLKAWDSQECISIPPNRMWEKGDTAWVPVVNSYVEGKVTDIDKTLKRIEVSYEWGGETKKKMFPFLVATPDFDRIEPGEKKGRKRKSDGGERGDRAKKGKKKAGGGGGGGIKNPSGKPNLEKKKRLTDGRVKVKRKTKTKKKK